MPDPLEILLSLAGGAATGAVRRKRETEQIAIKEKQRKEDRTSQLTRGAIGTVNTFLNLGIVDEETALMAVQSLIANPQDPEGGLQKLRIKPEEQRRRRADTGGLTPGQALTAFKDGFISEEDTERITGLDVTKPEPKPEKATTDSSSLVLRELGKDLENVRVQIRQNDQILRDKDASSDDRGVARRANDTLRKQLREVERERNKVLRRLGVSVSDFDSIQKETERMSEIKSKSDVIKKLLSTGAITANDAISMFRERVADLVKKGRLSTEEAVSRTQKFRSEIGQSAGTAVAGR